MVRNRLAELQEKSGVKAPDSNTLSLYKKEEPATDFDLHILIPNLDIEVHAAQTPSPAKQSNVDINQIDMNNITNQMSATLAKMEILEPAKTEDQST